VVHGPGGGSRWQVGCSAVHSQSCARLPHFPAHLLCRQSSQHPPTGCVLARCLALLCLQVPYSINVTLEGEEGEAHTHTTRLPSPPYSCRHLPWLLAPVPLARSRCTLQLMCPVLPLFCPAPPHSSLPVPSLPFPLGPCVPACRPPGAGARHEAAAHQARPAPAQPHGRHPALHPAL
jgi:hypothetical protein